MGTIAASRREAEQRLRREHILLAAEQVFGRRPFDEASMQEIAREAGIGMHGLYQHFTSKQKMYEEILLGRVEEISRRLSAALKDAAPADRLRLLAVAYAGYFLEHPQFFPLFATRKLSRDWSLKSKVGKRLEQCMSEVESQVAETLEAAAKKGALRPLGTGLLTAAAIGMFTSVIQHHLLHTKSRDAEACAAEMLDLFFRGAAPRAGR
jgi:TetR/AcrR family transcriptional regulator